MNHFAMHFERILFRYIYLIPNVAIEYLVDYAH